MKSVNKVTLLGAVGKDPEMHVTQQGLSIASFSLATSEKRKDKEEVTQWHNCVAFGKLAEIVQKYVVKGSKLYVEGAIQYQVYDKEGEKRYSTKIVVNDVSLISSAEKSGCVTVSAAGVVKPEGRTSSSGGMGWSDEDDDEVPF